MKSSNAEVETRCGNHANSTVGYFFSRARLLMPLVPATGMVKALRLSVWKEWIAVHWFIIGLFSRLAKAIEHEMASPDARTYLISS